MANKCEIRIKNCFLRFSKSFALTALTGADAGAVTSTVATVVVLPIGIFSVAVDSGDLLCLMLRMSTSLYMGERLREWTLLEVPDLLLAASRRVVDDDVEDLCVALRFDFDGELAGELLLRFDVTGEPPLCAKRSFCSLLGFLSRELEVRLTGDRLELLPLCRPSEPDDDVEAVELLDSLLLRLLLPDVL